MRPNVKVSNSRSHVWPAIRLGLAAEIAALNAELNDIQWLDPDAVEALQMAQFRVLLQFSIEHSSFYAQHTAGSGVSVREFDSIESLQRLPLLSRQDLQRAGDGFFCVEVPADQGKIFDTQTSGSTGQPVRVRRTGVNRLFGHVYSLRNYDWQQIPYNTRYSIIRPPIQTYEETPSLGVPLSLLYVTGPVQKIPMSTSLLEQSKLLRRFQPEMLLAYSSNLRGLLDLWREDGNPLEGLKYIRSVGETLSDDLRDAVSDFDPSIEVINGYSSEECGMIAQQCPQGTGLHVMSESVIVEVLDADGHPCAPGQVGRVVVTDLHNLAAPMIRYEIGDYAEVGNPCSCARGLMNLNRILGRSRNLVMKPNGDRYWPLVGFHAFESVAPIRQYQMIQETVERITVRFVCDDPLSEAQKAAFTEIIQKALTHEFELEILDQREMLPRQPGGKFEEFISKVS